MKKKVIIALITSMTLTLGSVGIAFAENIDFAPFHAATVTEIRDGYIWVVDKEAWDEEVHHPEEGHNESVLVSPEEGHYETVVVKPAWDEEKYVIDKEAWTETVEHPEEGHYETVVIKPAWDETVTTVKTVCKHCGAVIGDIEAHYNESPDCIGYSYGDKVFTETIHHDAVTEQKWVVDKEAWTETINHPEEGHTETIHHEAETKQEWVVDKEAVYEDKWVVDKEAWTETVHHPEEGHWEPVKDDTTPEKPENPEEPEKPVTPEKPETPDNQKPDTDNQTGNDSQNNTNNSTENTSSQETNTQNTTLSEKQPPKTGDPTSFASLFALAGSALVGGGALKLKFRKRK